MSLTRLRAHGFLALAEFGETDLLNIVAKGRKALKTAGGMDGNTVLLPVAHATQPPAQYSADTLQSEYEVRPDTTRNSPPDGAGLTALRRAAAGIGVPKRGIAFRVDAEGRAIVTGPARTQVPARFQRFANERGLTLVVRCGPATGITSGSKTSGPSALFNVDGHMSTGKTQYGAAMPVQYRESGALYFGEIGNGPGDGHAYLDRTGNC